MYSTLFFLYIYIYPILIKLNASDLRDHQKKKLSEEDFYNFNSVVTALKSN